MPEFGFRIFHIDISTGVSHQLEVGVQILRETLGGASLAARLLYPYLSKEIDPLSPDAPLLFLGGPLTGTKGTAVGRFVVCAKSPATGIWGESNVGGYFGPEMRMAGVDGIWITGRAPQPVYLWVHDGNIEICDAGGLWGKCDPYETQALIREAHDDSLIRVASIGLAGEKQLRFASILCDHGRMAGRTGMGAVMGSKRLKAIAARGKRDLLIAYPDRFAKIRTESNRSLRSDNVAEALRQFGSSSASDYLDYLGDMPKYYFTKGLFDGAERVSGEAMAESILSGVSTCHGCVIACGRVVRLADGQDRKGPEYETSVGFGPNLGIDDLSAITRLGELCDRYGMDTISVSNTIGLAFLLYEQGIISEADTDGEALKWGEPAVAERLIHRIAKQEGFGQLLSLGAEEMAKHFDASDMAVHVKGLEMPYHDPRALSGMGVVYATSPRGACHNQSDYFMVEIGQTIEEVGVEFFARQAGEEKAANVARHQDWCTVLNSLVMCIFANVPPHSVLEMINAVTGFDYNLDELMQVGERGWNIKRMVNIGMGITPSDDCLPKSIMKPLEEGGAAGYVIPIDEMLEAYYRARDWNTETGLPSREKMAQLKIEEDRLSRETRE
jgi:aldehyde:ferredoxin oxidoreductase